MYAFRNVRTLSSVGLQAMRVGRIHQRRIVSLALPAMQNVITKKMLQQGLLTNPINKYDLTGTGILSSSCSQFSTSGETVSEENSEVIKEVDDSFGNDHKWPSPVSTHLNRNAKSVFVGGYNFDHDESNLKNLFSKFGEIDRIQVPFKDVYLKNPPSEDAYRFAFVYFKKNESVHNALQQESINSKSGETIDIKERQRSKKEIENEKTIVVYNLPNDITADSIVEKFNVFGDIELANFVFNNNSKVEDQSKNVAFIIFKGIPDFRSILSSSISIDANELVVKQISKSSRRQPRNRCQRIFIENLPHDFSEDDILKNHFSTYGTVEYVKIFPEVEDASDESKTSRAFIHYSNYEEALSASKDKIQNIDGTNVTVRSLGWKQL